jgi:hypothetical protein
MKEVEPWGKNQDELRKTSNFYEDLYEDIQLGCCLLNFLKESEGCEIEWCVTKEFVHKDYEREMLFMRRK